MNTTSHEPDLAGTITGDDAELAILARAALDDSVDHLDAATLSRLNQARHNALETGREPLLKRLWLPFGAAGVTALALVVALPLLSPGDTTEQLTPVVEDPWFNAAEDLQIVEDLDLVLALLDNEDHAS